MLISTRTLTINAAFFQDLKTDSVRLRELLAETLHAFEEGRSSSVILNLLRQLREQLAIHFSLEECLGYFDDALVVAPQLSRTAETLRSQHNQLYIKANDLADDAERLLYRELSAEQLRVLASRYVAFYEQLIRHEEAENELIMQALYDDLGTGD